MIKLKVLIWRSRNKVVFIFPMAITSEFRIGQCRDDKVCRTSIVTTHPTLMNFWLMSILRVCYWKHASDLKAYFNLLTSLIKLIWVFHFNINIILTVFIRQETIMLLIASVRSKQIFTETILPSIFGDRDYCLDKDNTFTFKFRYK